MLPRNSSRIVCCTPGYLNVLNIVKLRKAVSVCMLIVHFGTFYTHAFASTAYYKFTHDVM